MSDSILPPLSAYEAWWSEAHPHVRARHCAPPPSKYRHLAKLNRSGASRAEKSAALGVHQETTYRMTTRLPETLK